jgi:hypothetical protein
MRVYEWIKRCLKKGSLGIVTGPPAGYRELESRLLMRRAFPSLEWETTSLPVGFVRPVLRLLQDQAVWPNDFFAPDDPFAPFLNCSSYPHAGEDFLWSVRKEYGVEYTTSEKHAMVKDGWTMAEFVSDLRARM